MAARRRRCGCLRNDELSKLADLLDQVSLEDKAACVAGEWRERVRPVTRPFLKRVMDRVAPAVSEQWSEDGLERKERGAPNNFKKAHNLDRLWIKVPRKERVKIGPLVGQTDDQRELENKLIWGVRWGYGGEELPRIRKEFEQLCDSLHRGFAVRVVDVNKVGDKGYYCLLCKTRSPDELRASDPEALIEEMAGDLIELYGRLRMPDGREDNGPVVVKRPSHRPMDLNQWLKQRGLIFTDDQLATYYTALQTKGFVLFTSIPLCQYR